MEKIRQVSNKGKDRETERRDRRGLKEEAGEEKREGQRRRKKETELEKKEW